MNAGVRRILGQFANLAVGTRPMVTTYCSLTDVSGVQQGLVGPTYVSAAPIEVLTPSDIRVAGVELSPVAPALTTPDWERTATQLDALKAARRRA